MGQNGTQKGYKIIDKLNLMCLASNCQSVRKICEVIANVSQLGVKLALKNLVSDTCIL